MRGVGRPGPLAVKLGRDLRATWPRIVLMVIAIAVSLTAFSAVLYAWSAIGRETERAYLSTEPASATIKFSPTVDADEMATIVATTRERPGILEATGRTQFTSDVEVDGRALEIQLQVFAAAPDDPLQMAKFFPELGSWPPAPGEILLGNDSLSVLDVAVGDTVAIEAPDGTQLELRIAGTVYDPSLSPAFQEQRGRGYVSTAALTAGGDPDTTTGPWSATAPFDQLKIQVGDPGAAVPSRDRAAIVDAASDVGRWLQREHGVTIKEIQVPEPYAHPHEGQADSLLTALLIGAGTALLLSTILVANMLGGLFAQQIPQIGIMKAIGAGPGRIARLYLAMTLVVAGAATTLAVAPGIMIGRAFTPGILSTLNIKATSTAPAWWTYVVVLAAGLLLSTALALVPIIRTSRTTVRAAIDHRGVGAHPRVPAEVLAWLGRLPLASRGLRMAMRNTVRRPARFALSSMLLASAAAVFVAGMSAREGMSAIESGTADQRQWDVVVTLAEPVSMDTVAPVLREVPNLGRIEGWVHTTASVASSGELPVSRTYPDQGHGRLSVTAIPAGSTMFVRPDLREGRWPEPEEASAIVLNQVAVANSEADIEVGNTVELSIAGQFGSERTTWEVVGITEELGAHSSAYVTAAGFAAAMEQPRWSNTLQIATSSSDEPVRDAVAVAVGAALADGGIGVRSIDSVDRLEAVTAGHLEPILVILLATALPMGVIGVIGLASTMGANVLERIREFGVMHAIGARPRTVRRIVVAEGVFVALASCVLAILPALGLTALMGSLLGNTFMYAPLPFRVSALAVVIWTVLVILGAILATDAAAARASRLTVREALAYL